MHDLHITHRDIKPDNIVFRKKKNNKNLEDFCLVDFGLSTTKLTNDNPIYLKCGTPGFIAPEIFTSQKGSQITEVSDVFSLGAVAFILLSGQFPFRSIDI